MQVALQELVEVRAYVHDRLDNRPFAEHPEDRVELMHKAQILDDVVKRTAGYPVGLDVVITVS